MTPSDHFGLNYDPSHMVWQHTDELQPMLDFAISFSAPAEADQSMQVSIESIYLIIT